jgi:hypothetical protein
MTSAPAPRCRSVAKAWYDVSIGAGVDPIRRETLSNIREFWIALAQESRFLSDHALAAQIETIGRLHAKFDREMRA